MPEERMFLFFIMALLKYSCYAKKSRIVFQPYIPGNDSGIAGSEDSSSLSGFRKEKRVSTEKDLKVSYPPIPSLT